MIGLATVGSLYSAFSRKQEASQAISSPGRCHKLFEGSTKMATVDQCQLAASRIRELATSSFFF